MAKRDFYYKFMIKLNRKMTNVDIYAIKKAIQRILIDTPITNIQGGEANNTGYYKFSVENENKIQQFRC